jgi:hypothetical protein
MNTKWNAFQTWVGHFDILGFKGRINNQDQSLLLEILKSSIDEVINHLEKTIKGFEDVISYTAYADTFIIYSKKSEASGYLEIDTTSKSFLNTCVMKRLPVRGAISFGELILGHNNRTIMGKAFLESYEYGEDQNWIGLILTPTAASQLKSMGADPINNGFINRDIPLRRYSIFDEDVYAYRFINGSTSFQCPLLPILNEMLQKAPNREKVKYMNTIRFIERYYSVHGS